MREIAHHVGRRVKDVTPPATRRRVLGIRFAIRSATASHRTLPDVLVVGAQRCGTSSLYKLLGRHPRVIPSLRKEVEYFSTRYPEGVNWYRTHFPLSLRLEVSQDLRGRVPLTFEATPDYLLDPRAAERAAELLPEARIVALVRDPIDRAFSQYLHNRRLDHEPLAFEAALDAEPERLEGEVERMLDDPAYPGRRFRRYSYVTRGLYADQIETWREWFDWDRFLVIRSEDFFADPGKVYRQCVTFLGLPPWMPRRFPNYSYASNVRSPGDEVPKQIRDRLAGVFAPHNRRLAQMLGMDLAWYGVSPMGGGPRPSGEQSASA